VPRIVIAMVIPEGHEALRDYPLPEIAKGWVQYASGYMLDDDVEYTIVGTEGRRKAGEHRKQVLDAARSMDRFGIDEVWVATGRSFHPSYPTVGLVLRELRRDGLIEKGASARSSSPGPCRVPSGPPRSRGSTGPGPYGKAVQP
jgi:hypothetical protein